MNRMPDRTRLLSFTLVALGFIAEIVGIRMMSQGQSPTFALGVMGFGVLLVMVGMVLRASRLP